MKFRIIIATVLAILIACPVFAAKISQYPSGGSLQNGDTLLIVRGGTDYQVPYTSPVAGVSTFNTRSGAVALTAPDVGSVLAITSTAHEFLTALNSSGVFSQAQPAFADISGVATVGQLPTGTSGAVIGLLNGNLTFSGTDTFTALHKINLNAAALPAAQTGAVLQIGNADGTPTRAEIDAFASAGYFSAIRSDTTNASPTTLQGGDEIGGYNSWGYNGSAVVGPRASFRTYAAQNWTTGANGTYTDVATTLSGTTTMSEVIRFENDGGVTLPSTVTGGDMGAGTINAAGIYVNGAPVAGGGTPGGSSGFVQTNNGSGGFGGFSLAATSGNGTANGGVLFNSNGVSSALSFGTNSYGFGGSPEPETQAASGLYQFSNAMIVDPRYYGATCDARYFDGRAGRGIGTITASSNTISISGYTFSSGDVGKSIAINRGNLTAGIGVATITAVNTTANTATISLTPTFSSTSAYMVMGHDDTTAIHNAEIFSSQYRGSIVYMPDHCLVHELPLEAWTTLLGNMHATGYNYNESSYINGEEKPTLYILGTGFSEDTTKFGINITNAQGSAIVGLQIKGLVFPFINPGDTNQQLTCVGTATSDPLVSQAVILDTDTINSCWVGFGGQLNTVNSGFITFMARNNQFSEDAWGMRGKFQDSSEFNDVYTGNFGGGSQDFESGNMLRIEQNRYEESPNNSIGEAVLCNGCALMRWVGSEWQFNGSPAIKFSGGWSEITITGGYMEGNGVSYAAGSRAQVLMAGTGQSLTMSNVAFSKNNFSEGGASEYVIDFEGTDNKISIDNGYACTNAYSVAFAKVGTALPTTYRVNTFDCPYTMTGNTTALSGNGLGSFGIGTSTPNANAALDMGSTTSAIVLPVGTTAQEPSSSTPGMIRYNSTVPQFEGYISGSWQPFGGAITFTPSSVSTLTNKTYDTAGTGNVFKINGTLITGIGGNTGLVATTTGTRTSGDCVEYDANGNEVDAGGPCTTGGGGGTVTSATAGQVAFYNATGTVVVGVSSLPSSFTALGASTTATSPARSGDLTTGLYSSSTGLVDIASSGTKSMEIGSTGVTIPLGVASALTVGPNGATNPTFAINSSASSSANGLQIVSSAAGSGVVVNTISSNGTENLTFNSKSSGDLVFNTNGGSLKLNNSANTILKIQSPGQGIQITPSAVSSGSLAKILYTQPADTGLSAGTEAVVESFNNAAAVRQHATGALSLQRDFVVQAATNSFSAASTLTNMASIGFSLPGCGTNATCTNASGIYHASTALTTTGAITNSYAINVAADTGATNNYAAQFVGPVVNTATITTGGYTVSSLPSGTSGMRAYVTDATSCTFMGALTGGGSTVCPVFYNGSAWVGG